jgi:hypothetical protein
MLTSEYQGLVQQTTLGVDARSSQVRKILESRAFRNTEVLKRLLQYLVQQALAGQAGDLKEYTVGVEAFGKPADYDPRSDASVRVQTGKLRQKLEEYYRTEGIEDDLVVELPKGHFKLEFRPRQTETAAPPTRPRWAAWTAVAILAVVAVYALIHSFREPVVLPALQKRWTPEMEEFWRPFLTNSRPLMVMMGAPLFTKVGNSFFRDPALNTWEAASQSEQIRGIQREIGGDAPAVPSYGYTGVGEATGAFELARLLLPRGRDLSLQVSNQLTWDELTRYDMIFVGPPKYNLQTNELPVRQDFEISHAHVQNLRPGAGEPRSFEEKWNPDRATLAEGHALITRIPGLHRSGNVLILAGSATESTRAAVEYVTRPEYVGPFIQWMRAQGGVPAAFQVVIRAKFKSQTPIAIDRVAFHELK